MINEHFIWLAAACNLLGDGRYFLGVLQPVLKKRAEKRAEQARLQQRRPGPFLVEFVRSLPYRWVDEPPIPPNRVTWGLWSLTAYIAFYFQLEEGVGLPAILTLSVAIIPSLIFVATFRVPGGYWGLGWLDGVCGVLAVGTLVLWFFTESGDVAIALIVAVDLLAGIPTVWKAARFPASEHAAPYIAAVASSSITLLMVTEWTFAATAYAWYLLGLGVVLCALLLLPRPAASLSAAVSAEFTGMLLLCVIGLGALARDATTTAAGGLGASASSVWAWGLGLVVAMLWARPLSGGHLNPAVTIALAAAGRFPWRRVAPYVLAQTAGAFIAAAIVRFGYGELIARVDPGHTVTQSIFSALPGAGPTTVSIATAAAEQIIGAAILLGAWFTVAALVRDSSSVVLQPIVVGLAVVAIGIGWGSSAGYAINPARDFGPRLLSWLTGYESAFIDQTGYPYWWIPLLAPVLGGLLGVALFRFGIERHLPTDVDVDAEPDVEEEVVEDPYAGAVAVATEFAVIYLTWDERRPDARGAALAPYFPGIPPSAAAVIGWNGIGHQTVELPPETEAVTPDPDHQRVTVALLVSATTHSRPATNGATANGTTSPATEHDEVGHDWMRCTVTVEPVAEGWAVAGVPQLRPIPPSPIPRRPTARTRLSPSPEPVSS